MKFRSISIAVILVAFPCLSIFSCGREGSKVEVTSEEQKTIEQTQKELLGAETQTAERELYACPMSEHWDIGSDNPGKCPKCGMNLVPLSQTEHKGDAPASGQATD